jgi:NAD+ kinase
MNKTLNTIGIILKPSKIDELSNTITNLTRWLVKRRKNIILLESEKVRLRPILKDSLFETILFVSEDSFFSQIDIVISFGGDGTLIGLSSRINSLIPIMGVNLGRLGFITEFSKSDFYERLNAVLAGKYEIETKCLYNVVITGSSNHSLYFLNDIVFTKNSISRIFSLNLEVNSEHVYDISGDGLIISTPIGSTAYSLAAGGPIIHPAVKALILTPICPHSLTHRPLVISEDAKIKVSLLDEETEIVLTIDGQQAIAIKKSDSILISKKNSKTISFIKNPERSYFQTLKEKFVHGRQQI